MDGGLDWTRPQATCTGNKDQKVFSEPPSHSINDEIFKIFTSVARDAQRNQLVWMVMEDLGR